MLGSRRVFGAAADAGVGALVHASSVGAYSPGPKDDRVDESWATGGIDTSAYSRHKARVERLLDPLRFEHPRRPPAALPHLALVLQPHREVAARRPDVAHVGMVGGDGGDPDRLG